MTLLIALGILFAFVAFVACWCLFWFWWMKRHPESHQKLIDWRLRNRQPWEKVE